MSVSLIVVMDHLKAVPCPNPPPQPLNVGVYAISDTSIFVVWDKPLGNGYGYHISIQEAGTEVQSNSGNQGFGNAGFVQIKGLTAESQYTATVQLMCTEEPNALSLNEMVLVRTLQVG